MSEIVGTWKDRENTCLINRNNTKEKFERNKTVL